MLAERIEKLRRFRVHMNFPPDYVPNESEIGETEDNLATAYEELCYLSVCPGADSDFRLKLDQAKMALAALARPFDNFKKGSRQ